jgi:cell division septal protein FtsQ
MSAVSAPADRRFRRAHVKPGRRRGRWRALAWPAAKYGLLVPLAAYAAYHGGSRMADASALRIDRIVVRGNEWLSQGEALAVLDGLRGENILWADLDGGRRRLLASPWVREAALRRSLPSTVEALISERQPIAIGRINGALYLVDERGLVIDAYGPRYVDFDLPIVDGLAAAPPDGRVTDQPRADLAARVIAALRGDPDVAPRLSQIDVGNLQNASVILSGDPAVLYVGRERFLPRVRTYLQLAGAIRARVPEVDYVDLRFDGRIYVRPSGAGGSRRAGTRPAGPDAAAR